LESVVAPAGAEDGTEGEGLEGGVDGGVEGDEDAGSEEEGAAAVDATCVAPPQPVIASAHVDSRNQKSVFTGEDQALLREQTGISCNPGGQC
jgi:hypothetical protein